MLTAAVACVLALAGCGSNDGGGLQGPDIGKAKSFALVGLDAVGPVQVGKPTTLKLHVEQPQGGPLTRFKTGSGPHTGVHLIMVRDDLSQIIHRHPPIAADGTITQSVTFPEPGPWHVVVDVYPDLGANTLPNFQLTGTVKVAGAYKPRPLPALAVRQTVDGNSFTMKPPAKLVPLKPEYLEIDVQDAQGRPAKFEQYYGALAHAIFFHKGTLAYFHTHVCGPGAPACAAAVGGSTVTGRSSTPGKLRVGMLLPSAGTWKLFLQAEIGGRIVTVPYTLKVA